jgi:predicted N-acetyltransferase YhbS
MVELGSTEKLTKPAPLRADHVLTGFDCGEEVLNLWLARRALSALAERTANTFVVCRAKRVVGYYSLATASIAHADSTSSLRRNTPDPVPAMILARLAVDRSERGHRIGRHLLQDAMRRTLLAARHVAARTLLVHALNAGVANYYRKLGFVDLPTKDGQITLHLTLEKIAAALKAGTQRAH